MREDVHEVKLRKSIAWSAYRAIDRQLRVRNGEAWLFFGERRADCDFLYRSEFESFVAGHELSRLDTAFSRGQLQKNLRSASHARSRKRDLVLAVGQRGNLRLRRRDLHGEGRRYSIAGVAKHGRRSAAQAQREMHAMAADGRYLRDVYETLSYSPSGCSTISALHFFARHRLLLTRTGSVVPMEFDDAYTLLQKRARPVSRSDHKPNFRRRI
jgi:hypothetical protein